MPKSCHVCLARPIVVNLLFPTCNFCFITSIGTNTTEPTPSAAIADKECIVKKLVMPIWVNNNLDSSYDVKYRAEPGTEKNKVTPNPWNKVVICFENTFRLIILQRESSMFPFCTKVLIESRGNVTERDIIVAMLEYRNEYNGSIFNDLSA